MSEKVVLPHNFREAEARIAESLHLIQSDSLGKTDCADQVIVHQCEALKHAFACLRLSLEKKHDVLHLQNR